MLHRLRPSTPAAAAVAVVSLLAGACGQGPPEGALSRAEPVVPLAAEVPDAVLEGLVDLGQSPAPGDEVPT
ncbi:MAG: hypothetical protein M3N11_01920, partial [Actinomycetota bacterium]|nr:hypothetical protein [Actinomycetota bacterium]